DVARNERVRGGPGEPGSLVELQADAVAEAVAEVLAVAGRIDDVARDRVDLAALGTRAHGVQRGDLGAENEVVGLLELVRERPCGPRARAVRAVAVELDAEVQRDERV